MEKRTVIDNLQKMDVNDVADFGLFPEASIDHIVLDTIIPDQGYTGFPVVQSAPAQVTAGNGRFYQAGLVYFNDTSGGQVIDLIASLPLVTNKIAAIVVFGTSVTAKVEPRTFLTDAVTRASQARSKSTQQWRWATLSVVNGAEGPDPLKPAVASNVCVVAWVKLGTSGIISIAQEPANRVPSVRGASTRLDAIEEWESTAGSILATLRSDLSGLSARLKGLATENLVIQVAEDVARLKEKAGLPQTYAAFAADHFLDTSQSDVLNPAYVAKIEEGVRFADIQVQDDQLGLLNPLDPNVMVGGNFMLPAFDPITLISQVDNVANYTELSLANYQYQTFTWTKLTRTRSVVRYGTPFVVCTNSWWWTTFTRIYPNVFLRAGETFNLSGPITGQPGHQLVRLQKFWTDVITESYWDWVSATTSVSGSVVAQTFLNAQSGYLIEIGLLFSRVAATGDVSVAICKTINGAPDPTRIVASQTVLRANIVAGGRTPVPFAPVTLDPGVRYGFIIVTPGNHYVYMTGGNKLHDGSLFTSTDGAWFQGDLLKDIAFDCVFAKFRASRVEIQLLPLQLAGGIAGIAINADTSIPGGTELNFQVQQNGVWATLNDVNALTGLPAILPFRAVFTGTSAVMPGLGLLSNSRVRTSRPRTDETHISTAQVAPSACSSIHVDIRVESWLDVQDTLLCRILSGAGFATSTTPATIVIETPAVDPNARVFHYVFTMAPAVTTFKIQLIGTISNAVTPYVVSERANVDII